MKIVDSFALAFSHQTRIEQAISMVSQSASVSVEKYSCNEKRMHFREPIFNVLRIQRSLTVSTAKKCDGPL